NFNHAILIDINGIRQETRNLNKSSTLKKICHNYAIKFFILPLSTLLDAFPGFIEDKLLINEKILLKIFKCGRDNVAEILTPASRL
ncbi:MAG: hypothetical protein ACRCU2_29020, partial [Planktothrix sp.]